MSAVYYRVLIGINYSGGKRAEPGDIVDDLPVRQLANLRALGAIEAIGHTPPEGDEVAHVVEQDDEGGDD